MWDIRVYLAGKLACDGAELQLDYEGSKADRLIEAVARGFIAR
jgi:hypothetical protein